MRIVKYSPEYFTALQRAVVPRRPESALLHQPFVDYYYASEKWCWLLVALDKRDEVIGTLGVDQMRFETAAGEMTLGFGSNYNSFLPGVGSFLFLRRLQECPLGLVFWSTADTQKLIKSLGWTYYHNIRRHYLNYTYPSFPKDPLWRKAAKNVLRRLPRKMIGKFSARLSDIVPASVSVHPESSFSDDMLPDSSPFAFRFAPSLAYLEWRYNTDIKFVRYRLFRIVADRSTVGYVVINDMPDRIVVSQCDGVDPVTLAYGVLSSIVETGKRDRYPRTVMLTSSHALMGQLYREFGFRVGRTDECFAIGGYKQDVSLNPDTSSWLVNFDWGNNDLQTPFLDQLSAADKAG